MLSQWLEVARHLWPGLGLTLRLTGVVFVLTVVFALVLAIMAESGSRLLRIAASSYIQLFRAIPQLALLYLIFFGAPVLSHYLLIPPFWTAVVSLTIGEAAYTGAIYQAAIRSVPMGQWEAGYSIGVSRGTIYRSIVLPQAVLPAIGPSVNMLMYTVKGTALASFITVNEMTARASSMIVTFNRPLQVFTVLMLMYVVITIPLGYLGRFLERQFSSSLGGLARLGQ